MLDKVFFIFIILVVSISGCSHLKTKSFVFVCPDGVRIKISYHQEGKKATLVYQDRIYELERTVSASGARYSDGHLVFWNKADRAFIEIDGKKIHQFCELRTKIVSYE